jgi:hypothetical protein
VITEITKEQEAKMPEYVDKWVGIGLNTNRINQKKAKKTINDLYKLMGKELPEQILFFDSPVALWDHIQKVTGVKMEFVWPYLSGSFDANIFAFYDYCIEVLGCKIEKELLAKYMTWKGTSELGLIYPFDDVCLVSEKPVEIHRKGQVLHNENGPAVKYAGGFSLYMLNGVRVKEEYVTTPWNKLDCTLIAKEQNAEVRRELVRKIGIERIVKELGAKVLDAEGDYELILLKIGRSAARPYLKMKNPSIGTYHIEGVPPGTKTVKEALVFRNGTDETPEILT